MVLFAWIIHHFFTLVPAMKSLTWREWNCGRTTGGQVDQHQFTQKRFASLKVLTDRKLGL